MGTLGFERVGIASQIAILAADLRAMTEAARCVNPGALDDPSLRDRIAKVWTEIELARLLSLRALSKIMKGEKNWPEVPFAKLSWSSMAQTLAELAVDLLGPAGALGPGRPGRGRPGQMDTALRLPALLDDRRRLHRNPEEHHRRPRHCHARQVARLNHTAPLPADPRATCIIGVARHTWHPSDTPDGAPEPLAMWEQMARAAATDTGVADPASLLAGMQSIDIVYSQSWQYDDAVARLAERIGASPARAALLRHRRVGAARPCHRGGARHQGRRSRPGTDHRSRGIGHRAPSQEGRREAAVVLPSGREAAASRWTWTSTPLRSPMRCSRPTSPSPSSTTPGAPTSAGVSTSTASNSAVCWRP